MIKLETVIKADIRDLEALIQGYEENIKENRYVENHEFFKGKIQAYKFSVKLMKRNLEWFD